MTSLDSSTIREPSSIWNRSRLSGHLLNLFVLRLYWIFVGGVWWLVVIFSFSISRTGERLDVTVRVLLSRVAGIAIGSRGTLPLSEVTLEHAAALPMSSL